MKKRIYIATAIFIALASIIFFTAKIAHSEGKKSTAPAATSTPQIVVPRFSHQQEIWMAALEWCESRGNNSAINWYDKDGTASYYAFQFKPGTLR